MTVLLVRLVLQEHRVTLEQQVLKELPEQQGRKDYKVLLEAQDHKEPLVPQVVKVQ
jgi:hypothetical protein